MQWQGTIDFAKGILLNGKPHGIERGTTLPTWESTDEGKLFYAEDTGRLWVGTDSLWLELTPGGIESHDHDDRYYTETEIETSGQSSVHYDNVTNVPSFIQASDVTYETLLANSDIGTGNDQVSLGSHAHTADAITYDNGSSGMTATEVQAAIDELDTRVESSTIIQSLNGVYEIGSVVDADTGDVDWQLTDDVSFLVSDFDGVIDILKVTAALAGDTVDIVGSFGQSGGTVTLNASGAVDINSTAGVTIDGVGASNVSTTSGNLSLSTIINGNVEIVGAVGVSIDDAIQSSPILFSQTDANGFATEFDWESQTHFDWTVRDIGEVAVDSIMGAINSNRQDMFEFVELIRTEGATYTAAAGASLVGVDGILGITPSGENLSDTSNLQAMIEGIADSAISGAVKSYADETAFTTAKSGSVYLPVGSIAYIQDTNRFVEVLVYGDLISEGTDWNYVWNAANPLSGEAFNVTTNSITLDSGTGAVDIDGASVNIDASTSGIVISSSGSDYTMRTLSSGTLWLISAGVLDMNGTSVDIDASNGITLDENSGGHIGITVDGQVDIDSAGSQIVEITSDTEIDLTATNIDINGDTDVSGTFTMGSLVLPVITADPLDSPSSGTSRFRTDTNTLWIHNGTVWVSTTLA